MQFAEKLGEGARTRGGGVMAFGGGGGVITKHSNDMAVYVCVCVCVLVLLNATLDALAAAAVKREWVC